MVNIYVLLSALFAAQLGAATRVAKASRFEIPEEREEEARQDQEEKEKEAREQLQRFKDSEAADAAAGKSGTEVRRQMVYRLQPYSFPLISGCNVALDVGEIAYIAGYGGRKVADPNTVIVQHDLEFEVPTDPDRAERHFVKLNHGMKPQPDPVEYGINDVGLLMKERGGWLSLPSDMQCGMWGKVGDGCAWRSHRRVKTIHTNCLMEVVDDGIGGTGHLLKDFLFGKHFTVHEGTVESLGPSEKIALKLFHRGFAQCPDVVPMQTVASTLMLPGIHAKATPIRRCCCFRETEETPLPRWVQGGVCLPNEGPLRLFANMWSMYLPNETSPVNGETTLINETSPITCNPEKALYQLNQSRGRCLTTNEATDHESSAESEDTMGDFGLGHGAVTFDNVFPSLRMSAWKFLGGQLWSKDKVYVCDASFGMHHEGCDCEWAGDQC